MEKPIFTRPGEGERVTARGHRVLGELPHLETIGLEFGHLPGAYTNICSCD